MQQVNNLHNRRIENITNITRDPLFS